MKKSAGILPYRIRSHRVELFLVHPGGPLWKNKDLAVWSIAKGEFNNREDPLDAAIREFKEETGFTCTGPFIELGFVKQKSGKLVYGWGTKAEIEPSSITSNDFQLEWPPGSGKINYFPEVDKAGWFSLAIAKQKINPAQIPFIDELMDQLPLTE